MRIKRLNKFLAIILLLSPTISHAVEIDQETIRIADYEVPVGAEYYTRSSSGVYTFEVNYEFQVDTLAAEFLKDPIVQNSRDNTPNVTALEQTYIELQSIIGGSWVELNTDSQSFAECADYKFKFLKDQNIVEVTNAKSDVLISAVENPNRIRCMDNWVAITIETEETIVKAQIFQDGEDKGQLQFRSANYSGVTVASLHGLKYFAIAPYYLPHRSNSGEVFALVNSDGKLLGRPETKRCGTFGIFQPVTEFGPMDKQRAALGSITDASGKIILQAEIFKDIACQDDGTLAILVGGVTNVDETYAEGIADELNHNPGEELRTDGTAVVGLKDKKIFAFLKEDDRVFKTVSVASETPSKDPAFKVQFEVDNQIDHFLFTDKKFISTDSRFETDECPHLRMDVAEDQRTFRFYIRDQDKPFARVIRLKDFRCNRSNELAILAEKIELPVTAGNDSAVSYAAVFNVKGDMLSVFPLKQHLAQSISHAYAQWWRVWAGQEASTQWKPSTVMLNASNGTQYPGTLPRKEVKANPAIQDLINSSVRVPETLVENYVSFQSGAFEPLKYSTTDYLKVLNGSASENIATIVPATLASAYENGKDLSIKLQGKPAPGRYHCDLKVIEDKLNESREERMQNSIVTDELLDGMPFSGLVMEWFKSNRKTRYWFGLNWRSFKSPISEAKLTVVRVDAFRELFDADLNATGEIKHVIHYCGMEEGRGDFL